MFEGSSWTFDGLRWVERGDVCGVLMVDIYSAPEAGVQDTMG